MKKVREILFICTMALGCASAICMIVLWFVAVPRTAKIAVAATFVGLGILLLIQLIVGMIIDEKSRKTKLLEKDAAEASEESNDGNGIV